MFETSINLTYQKYMGETPFPYQGVFGCGTRVLRNEAKREDHSEPGLALVLRQLHRENCKNSAFCYAVLHYLASSRSICKTKI